MLNLALKDVAQVTGGVMSGADVVVNNVSTDTRDIAAGDLFLAIAGERFDGHDFVEAAQTKGAVAAVVAKSSAAKLSQVLVDDTLFAYGQIAAHWRQQQQAKVIGITGSSGKTTVKEMIAAILRVHSNTLATEANYNNEIGLPRTLLQIRPDHDFAVVEMGAGKPGDIAYLAAFARPDVAIVTNAGPAHIERLRDVETVAKTKGAMYSCSADNAVAVINLDDTYAPMWLEMAGLRKVITFGEHESANFRLVEKTPTVWFIETPFGEFDLQLQLLGRHNALNALCALAATVSCGVDIREALDALASIQSYKGRLQQRVAASGLRVIDDTYNANPLSMRAAIDVLVEQTGRKLLLIGDMGELGADSEKHHANIGRYAREQGVDVLVGVGPLCRYAVEAFGENAFAAEDFEAGQAIVAQQQSSADVVLVKGSRTAKMERFVAALTEGGNA